jgi:uncharacterized protein involved in exopolysaccharide biosynthesis
VAFRHKFKAILVFGCILGSAAAAPWLIPATYRSDAKLFLRIGRPSVTLDPTATVGQTVSVTESRERELNSAREILQSRELYESVVDEIGATEVLGPPLPVFSALRKPPSGPLELREAAIEHLEASVSSSLAKDSDILVLHCEARSAELAQRLLQSYISSFRSHYLKLHRTSGSYEFFANQAKTVKQQLEVVRRELKDAKNRVGIGTVEGQSNNIEQQITALEQQLQSKRSALASVRARLSTLKQQCPDAAATAPHGNGISSATAVDDMRSELYRLQIQERELMAKLSPEHPRMIAIREQTQQARQLLARQEFLAESTNEVTLLAEVSDLEHQLDEEKQRRLNLNENELSIRELEQKEKSLRANYATYEKNLEQLRIAGELESSRISNINVAQAPTLVSTPVHPRKLTWLLLGAVAGILAAVTVAFLCEFFDDSLQTPEQVETTLRLPVLLSIPDSPSHARQWCQG